MLQQNSQIDELSIILKNVLNPNQNIRKSSEEQIEQLLNQNFGKFIIELSKKISTESEEKQVRQISATIIKNMVNNIKYIKKWFELSENIKKTIKENVLSSLNSNDIDIRKAAALALAGICKVEIPKKQWLNIFDILMNTSLNSNLNVQLASLTTLEYIYEEIKKVDIPNNIVANLLNMYYSILSKDNINTKLVINTLNSILKFLPFISDFINDKNSKIKFYDLIYKFVKDNNEEIRRVSLQIFIDISKIYYDSLQDYIDNIFQFTKVIIEKDIESNKIICLDIWVNIGNIEDYRDNILNSNKINSNKYLQRYFQPLSELCLKYIITENYTSDEDSISKVSYTLLSFMSRCCSYDFILLMLKYIGTNINSNIEKIKYSALSVFKSIICTIHKNDFYPIIKDSLSMISDILLNNAPFHFKLLCSEIIKFITKYFGEELINDIEYFDKMIALYLELFKISSKEVLYYIIFSLNYLCKNVDGSEEDETNILSKHINNLIIPLINICSNSNYYDTKYNVLEVAFTTIGSLAEHSAHDVKEQLIDKFKVLSNMFEKTLDEKNFNNLEICNYYQEYIAGCLIGFFINGKADKNIAATLLQNVINSFEKRKSLYNEGVNLIGSISLFTQKYFDAVMQLILPYLIQGLKSFDSPSLCQTSIICLSEIIRALEDQNKYINQFLPIILNILSNDNITPSVKPYCFLILSDLFMNCPEEAFKYFEDIMKVIGGAMQATQIKLNEDMDQETISYFINLRENILETITCILTEIKCINKSNEFIPFVRTITNYINFIGNDSINSINIMKDGLFILAEFCNSYKGDMKPILDAVLIKEMFNKIKNDKKESKDITTQNNIYYSKKYIEDVIMNY